MKSSGLIQATALPLLRHNLLPSICTNCRYIKFLFIRLALYTYVYLDSTQTAELTQWVLRTQCVVVSNPSQGSFFH